MNVNPYEILGVQRNASNEDIDKAFKTKARKAHPDNGGSAEAFIELKQASIILLDPEKRRRFDRDGVVDGNNPDNTNAVALQRITMFFVRSIEASLSQSILQLNQLDLIQGADSFFQLEIQGCHKRIFENEAQIKQFEKVLKRLKTKRNKDVIKEMLNHHISALKNNILGQNKEIEIYDEAKLILKDYTFEQEQPLWLGGSYR